MDYGGWTVINAALNTASSINVPGLSPGVAANPNGLTAFVANQGDNTVSAIDTTTNALNTQIPSFGLGCDPQGVAFSRDGTVAYAIFQTPKFHDGLVTVLGQAQIGAAAPPAGTHWTAYSFTVPATNTNSFAVTGGALPAGLALDPATGIISGTPTTVGASASTVTATGYYNQTRHDCTLSVNAPALPSTTLPSTTLLGISPNAGVGVAGVLALAGVAPHTVAGTVTFSQDGIALPTCTQRPVNEATKASAGLATCVTTFTTAGTHTITATFSGDATRAGSAKTVSLNVTAKPTKVQLALGLLIRYEYQHHLPGP